MLHYLPHYINHLHIPVVGLIDTNCNPDGIDYVIPGNDDAIRSVKLIASALADAVIEAREGVSLNKETAEEDENFDLKAALAEVKPIAKEAEDKGDKKVKKTAKKPVKKEEKVAQEVATPAKEEVAEVKEEKVEEQN